MALLTGSVDGTMFSPITVVHPLAVDGTMTVFNPGPNTLYLDVGGLKIRIESGNSAVFSVPKGTMVQNISPAAGSWQLAVPD